MRNNYLFIFLFLTLSASGQQSGQQVKDYGWQTIFQTGSGMLQIRIFVNDPKARKSDWRTTIYCRSTFKETVDDFVIEGDAIINSVLVNQNEFRKNELMASGILWKGNNYSNDKVSDGTSFTNIHIVRLKIGGQLIYKDGKKIGNYQEKNNSNSPQTGDFQEKTDSNGQEETSKNDQTGQPGNNDALKKEKEQRNKELENNLKREKEQKNKELEDDLKLLQQQFEENIQGTKDPIQRAEYQNYLTIAQNIGDLDERKKYLANMNNIVQESKLRTEAIENTVSSISTLIETEVDDLENLEKGETMILGRIGLTGMYAPYFMSSKSSRLQDPKLGLSLGMDILTINGFSVSATFDQLVIDESKFVVTMLDKNGNPSDLSGKMTSNASFSTLGIGYNISLKNRHFNIFLAPNIGLLSIKDDYGWTYSNKKYQIEKFEPSGIFTWGLNAKLYYFLGSRLAVNVSYGINSPFDLQNQLDIFSLTNFSGAGFGIAIRF
ncbi:hypothetical protein [Flectobacillus roseus]|uniref:hypothetical protein n=1 Tax=Flectobacillus roseus TaxID=502259 RepID=UPI0024B67A05|nr:hypothetical protein [Flectobacillus roseus]MDI9867780.1 hypothetical protein [Flectobacillus roseus]